LALYRLGLSEVLFESGRHKQAASELREGIKLGDAMGSKLLQFIGQLLEARFSLQNGRRDAGLRSLAGALAIGKQQGFWTTYWWRSSVMARLCVAALEAGIEVPYVQELVRRRGLAPDNPPIQIADWPWAVKVFALGGFSVRKGDEPLQLSGKTQRKPIDLLKVLIASGGQDVSNERISDILWPDSDADAAARAFDTTLHRLRKLIGPEALVLRGGRLSLDARQCWVDAWALEGYLADLEAKLTNGRANFRDEEISSLAEKGFALYRGPFLGEDATDSWAVSMRDRLRSKFIRFASSLGRRCEASEVWEKAVLYYQRGLEADPLAEDLHRRLMVCYKRLGRPAEAMAAYQRCQTALSAFGLHPSPETQALVRTLL
jgi:DNA-binding SARP family transcriptional activator